MASDPAPSLVVTGNLVRWRGGKLGRDLGVVVETWTDGSRAKVLLDAGEELNFALPTDVLSRVTFPEGATVVVKNDGSHGVVTDHLSMPTGVSVYPESRFPTVQRRPFPKTACVLHRSPTRRRCSAGRLTEAHSAHNLRVAATRLALAHQFDELSSLSNSRVEIKPHQVGVLHRVATYVPTSLPARGRGRAREDDRGRTDHQGAEGPRRREPCPRSRAVRDRLAVAVRAEDEVQRGLRPLQPGRRLNTSRRTIPARTSGR